MSRKRTSEQILGQYFCWLVYKRNGVYQADGRRNVPSTGRNSLNTRNREVALTNLKQLDQELAVRRGLLDRARIIASKHVELPLAEGTKLYLDYVGRAPVAGGAKKSTVRRYMPVFKKAIAYFESRGISCWNDITVAHLDDYLARLDGEGYAYATEFLEGTTIKQANKYFVEMGFIPQDSRIRRAMPKPTGTDTYCYCDEEVAAMIGRCRAVSKLNWLGDVIVGLAHTGMRISELGDLTWSRVSMRDKLIVLKDESRSRRLPGRAARTTKGRRDRRLPIHETLYQLLAAKHEDGISGRVFHASKGGALHDGNLRKIFVEQVLTPLAPQFPSPDDEIGFKDGRLHSFRHYFCSWCSTSNVGEHAVMDWLGHRDSRMVRHYFHLHDPQAKQQMLKLGKLPGLDAS